MSEMILVGCICIGFSVFGFLCVWVCFRHDWFDYVLILLSLCWLFAGLGLLFCGVGFVNNLTHLLTKVIAI